jgi:hypothetical protein
MAIKMVRCLVCEKGTLHKGKVRETQFGVELGKFEGEKCDKCNETFLSGAAMKEIEKKARLKKR